MVFRITANLQIGGLHNRLACLINHTHNFPPLCQRSISVTTSTDDDDTCTSKLLQNLRTVDTSALCDADKTLRTQQRQHKYDGIQVMDYRTIRPMNHPAPKPRPHNCDGQDGVIQVDLQIITAGIARTVQFTDPNDFLPVLRALEEAEEDEVLVVNTLHSTRAVAGEIFCAQAHAKGLAGMVIDGPVRDTQHLSKYPPLRMYASGITPYSGTTVSVGKLQQPVVCGGVTVRPGDVVVGDEDGVLVGSKETFEQILPVAQQIQETERKLLDGLTTTDGTIQSIADMSNYQEHIRERLQGNPSTLQFRVS